MGWTIVDPHPQHECELPNYEERKQHHIITGTMIECDECGQKWQWLPEPGSLIRNWKRNERCSCS